MPAFEKMVEGHGDKAEREQRVTRLIDSLGTLGVEPYHDADGGKFYAIREKERKGRVREFPLGHLKLKGVDKSNVQLTLEHWGGRDSSLFIPDGDPARDFGDEHEHREGTPGKGLRMSAEISGPGKAITDHELGILYGVDDKGNPLISISGDELSEEEREEFGVENNNISHATLDPDSDRYKEAILALYGAADTEEARREKEE